jgi:hypothetical protein
MHRRCERVCSLVVTRASGASCSWVRLPVGAKISGFNSVVFSMVDDVPLDSETSVAYAWVSVCALWCHAKKRAPLFWASRS